MAIRIVPVKPVNCPGSGLSYPSRERKDLKDLIVIGWKRSRDAKKIRPDIGRHNVGEICYGFPRQNQRWNQLCSIQSGNGKDAEEFYVFDVVLGAELFPAIAVSGFGEWKQEKHR